MNKTNWLKKYLIMALKGIKKCLYAVIIFYVISCLLVIVLGKAHEQTLSKYEYLETIQKEEK